MKHIIIAILIGATLAACGQPSTGMQYQEYVRRLDMCIIQNGPEKPSVKDYCESIVRQQSETIPYTTTIPTTEGGR